MLKDPHFAQKIPTLRRDNYLYDKTIDSLAQF